MGNSHQSQRARRHADQYQSKWKSQNDLHWGYGRDRGPDTWWVHYPAAAGHQQSPIDINPENAEFDADLTKIPLQFHYSLGDSKLFYNTGHSCQVDLSGAASYITGGPFDRHRYKLKQFHFHWGDRDDCGSEHTVHGKAYAAEVHLVHWNCDLYKNYQEASDQPGGLAVLAVLIQPDSTSNQGLDYISKFLSDIQYKGQSAGLAPDFDIRHLLPGDVGKYWVYKGSLTTPPCHESVTWIVFYEPIRMTRDQLSMFRTLNSYGANEQRPPLDEFYGKILKNYRPVQPLGTRKIRTMEHTFMSHRDFDEQFHKQALFTTFPEIVCQFHRQGIHN